MKRYAHLLSGCTYLLFFLLLLKWIAVGALSHYVAPRMSYFIYGCAAMFLLMSLFQFYRLFSYSPSAPQCACHTHSTSRRKALYLHGVLFIPLVLGFAFPEKTLDSAVAEKRIIAASRPQLLSSAQPVAVPVHRTPQPEPSPAQATPSPTPVTSPSEKNKPALKTDAASATTSEQTVKPTASPRPTAAPQKTEPPKNDSAAEKKAPPKSAPAASTATPAPKQTPQPVAAAPSSAPADDNGQNDIEKFNQKEISIMQMRMGIGSDSPPTADDAAAENEGTQTEKIVLTDDNFATTMGQIFANPAAYTGDELEMTGFGTTRTCLPMRPSSSAM